MPTSTEARLEMLATKPGIAYCELSPMADTGLANDHVWVHRSNGSDWVASLTIISNLTVSALGSVITAPPNL